LPFGLGEHVQGKEYILGRNRRIDQVRIAFAMLQGWIKRAVRFSFLDFTTLERRKAALEAELHLNRRTAPGLYRRVLPVTRGADGALALDGAGAGTRKGVGGQDRWVGMEFFEELDDGQRLGDDMPVDLERRHQTLRIDAPIVGAREGGNGDVVVGDALEVQDDTHTLAGRVLVSGVEAQPHCFFSAVVAPPSAAFEQICKRRRAPRLTPPGSLGYVSNQSVTPQRGLGGFV
jgi:hypothetical protein